MLLQNYHHKNFSQAAGTVTEEATEVMKFTGDTSVKYTYKGGGEGVKTR